MWNTSSLTLTVPSSIVPFPEVCIALLLTYGANTSSFAFKSRLARIPSPPGLPHSNKSSSVTGFAPICYDKPCDLDNYGDVVRSDNLSPRSWIIGGRSGVPPIGTHFGQVGVAATLLAVLLDPSGQFNVQDMLHLWVRRYIGAVTVHGCANGIGLPWVFAFCPGPRNTVAWFGLIASIGAVAYIVSQGILCYITVLRLRLVASLRAAKRTNILLNILMLTGVLWAITYGLSIAGIYHDYAFLFAFATFFLSYVIFQVTALTNFAIAAFEASKQAQYGNGHDNGLRAARHALITALLLAASAGTTILFFLIMAAHSMSPSTGSALIWEISTFVDVASDAILALLCAGLIGPARRTSELAIVGDLVVEMRARLVLDKLKEIAHGASGPALALAALFEGQDPETLLLRAVSRFRCVSWDKLRFLPEVIIGGGPLDVVGKRKADLYKLSEPCQLATCDAFLSHSWHDNGEHKWCALSAWCEDFEQTQGRPPRLWLDICCIEQTSIESDLQCLPIFVAGCNVLLILSGLTYTSRLWCCLEMFVSISMLLEGEFRHAPICVTLGEEENDHERVRQSWKDFKASDCQCFRQSDKDRIMAVIERCPGGFQEFDAHVKDLAEKCSSDTFVMERLPSAKTDTSSSDRFRLVRSSSSVYSFDCYV